MKGVKGVSFSDRQLAGQVRNLALGHLKKILDPKFKDKEYQKDMLLKIAPNLLPRLNELTGTDGEPVKVDVDSIHNMTTKEIDDFLKKKIYERTQGIK